MPTPRQMHLLWESEMEFFGGQNPRDYQPKTVFPMNFTGEVIGTISVDPITKDLKIEPLPIPKEKDSPQDLAE